MQSSDMLWSCVMDQVLKIHPNSSNHWRLASPTKKECDHCVVHGGGPLVKCTHERCRKEYHMECAFKNGSFFIEESGDLTFLCSTHFKPILFCKCMQPYDEHKSAAMVCCDECIEWFHYSCVGLSASEASILENYICHSCEQVIKDGKTPSAQLKEKNLEKEKRSACHQDALKSMRILVEIAETVCPLIDQLNQLAASNKSEKHTVGGRFTAADMKDAASYLSAPPFVKLVVSDTGGEELNFLGARELIVSWKQQLVSFGERFNAWAEAIASGPEHMTYDNESSLEKSFVDTADKWIDILQQLDENTRGLPVPADVQGVSIFLGALIEAWEWYIDFLEVCRTNF